MVGDPRSLLQVVGHDHDRVVGLQLHQRLFELRRRDRVEGGGRLVEQDHFGADGDGAGDAEALLLTAGEAKTRRVQLVLHFVPERRTLQGFFDPLVEVGLGDLFIETHAEGHVVVDRHREGGRLLEHHADAGAQERQVHALVEHVRAVEEDLPLRLLAGIEGVDAVQGAQKRRLAAARRPDQARDRLPLERDRHVVKRLVLPVEEVEVLGLKLDCVGGDRLDKALVNFSLCVGHDRFCSCESTLTRMLMERTAKAINRAPTQARRCQSS